MRWIEFLFRFTPDNNSGTTEVEILLALCAAVGGMILFWSYLRALKQPRVIHHRSRLTPQAIYWIMEPPTGDRSETESGDRILA